jgi:proteasome accessory factor A
MSPFANALKIGTTAAVLSLLEQRQLPRNLVLNDAVRSTRDISRDPTRKWIIDLENGKTIGALDVQWQFHDLAQRHLRERDPETDWLLETWSFVLESIEQNPQALIGGVDWITKKWLLEAFMASEKIGWDDPWLQS